MTKDYPDGIYFDMPHDVYVALPRIGSSSIKDLIVSTATFWHRSWMNPNRDPEDLPIRDPKSVGTAFHMARLEPDRFVETYARGFDRSAYDDLLETDADVKVALKDLGEPQTQKGELALDRARRLLEHDPDARIASALAADHEEACFGRIMLPPDIWDACEDAMEFMANDQEMRRRFTGGFPEVTILWTDEHGTKLRARIDYLQAGGWADLKTFANPMRKPVDRCVEDAFRYNGYLAQAALYDMAIERVRSGDLPVEFWQDGSETGDQWVGAKSEMIDELREQPRPLSCHFVFVQSDGSPNLLSREIVLRDFVGGHDANGAGVDEDTLPDFMFKPSRLLLRGLMDVDKALRRYRWGCEAFLDGEAWSPDNAVGVIDEDCYPPNFIEGYYA